MNIRNAEKQIIEELMLGKEVPYNDPTMYRLFFKVKNNRAPHSSNIVIRSEDNFSISNNYGRLLLHSDCSEIHLNVMEWVSVLEYLASIVANFEYIPLREITVSFFPNGLTFVDSSVELSIIESYSFILSFAHEATNHEHFETIRQKIGEDAASLVEKGSELYFEAGDFNCWEGCTSY